MELLPTDLPERSPIASAPLSVVLPACNAAAYLEPVVSEWAACLDSLQRDYELFVVDDGSSDQTGARAEELTAQYPRLRVLRHPTYRGIGAALRTGLAAAVHPLFVCAEAEQHYRPAALESMLALIDQLDLVAGYRPWEPGQLPGRIYRWLTYTMLGVEASPGLLATRLGERLPARVLFGLRLRDVLCGFRLFRRELFQRIPIQSDGPFAHVEILSKANFLGGLMAEVPVLAQPHGDGPETPCRQTFAELRRILAHPDFGPAKPPSAG